MDAQSPNLATDEGGALMSVKDELFGARILVIEDDQLLAATIASFLQQANAVVIGRLRLTVQPWTYSMCDCRIWRCWTSTS